MNPSYRRPVTQPATQLDQTVAVDDAAVAHQRNQDTAWSLLGQVRAITDPDLLEHTVRLVAAADIEDISELWAASSVHSLAGQFWRLALLRHTVAIDPAGSAEIFRVGTLELHTIDSAVAGIAQPICAESIVELGTSILRGIFSGDLGVALDRAASYSRIMSAGATAIAAARDSDKQFHKTLTDCALRYATIANEFTAGAKRVRDGTLD